MSTRNQSCCYLSGTRLLGVLVTIVVSVFFFSAKNVVSSSHEVEPFNVVIDVSHGGKDNGSTNEALDLKEKELILDIAKKLKKRSKISKINYVLTRKKDVYMSLDHRIEFTNRIKPDLLVSLHVNESGDPQRSGSEAHYFDLSEFSVEAKAFSEILNQMLHLNSSICEVRATEYRILKETKCPAVLMHLGYITNASDAAYLDSSSNQFDAAQQIDEAIAAFRDRNLELVLEE